MGLVCGQGVYEKGEFVAYKVGENTLEYVTWNSMLNRALSAREKARNETYELCSVDERFLNFQWFARWANQQIGFGVYGYDLDKDVLFKGNKVYSPETCVFVPRKVNTFLLKCDSVRGKLPVGVSVDTKSGGFMSRCRVGGVRRYLGTYKTPLEAFTAYKGAKEAAAKALADEFEGVLDARVVLALRNFTVDIND